MDKMNTCLPPNQPNTTPFTHGSLMALQCDVISLLISLFYSILNYILFRVIVDTSVVAITSVVLFLLFFVKQKYANIYSYKKIIASLERFLVSQYFVYIF
uniref:Uncharacterized protein n=1 Tax=Cacopsylla melanoneura TaxID=428564 RepID=A0A8D9E486_9HEMI